MSLESLVRVHNLERGLIGQKNATLSRFRKNGMNVGMASTSIGRKEVSFIYVDHTINSACGQNDEDVRLEAQRLTHYPLV